MFALWWSRLIFFEQPIKIFSKNWIEVKYCTHCLCISSPCVRWPEIVCECMNDNDKYETALQFNYKYKAKSQWHLIRNSIKYSWIQSEYQQTGLQVLYLVPDSIIYQYVFSVLHFNLYTISSVYCTKITRLKFLPICCGKICWHFQQIIIICDKQWKQE